MKKLLSLVLILCMCLPFILTGCGDSGEKNAYQAFAAKVEKSSTHSLDGAVLEEISSGEFDEKRSATVIP